MDKEIDQQKMVSVIIPAFNEEKNIKKVISAAREHPLVKEVIVIDDGSKDKTAQEALKAGALVFKNRKNLGKAGAMSLGVKESRSQIISFLDADIIGLDHKMLEKLFRPVLSDQFDLYVAVRGRKYYLLNKILRFLPIIGGERCLKKELWNNIPGKYKQKFQIEIAMNYFGKINGYRMGVELFPNLSQLIKERKRGLIPGFWERLKMIAQILLVSFKLYFIKDLFYTRSKKLKNKFVWRF